MKTENLETLAFVELLKRTPDAFEAVAVMGLRSRQVVHRRMAERMLLEQDIVEDENEESFEPLEENEDYVEEEKETLLAVQDFFEDRLKWEFRPKDDAESGEADSKGL